jgi:hypothetical protein
MERESWGATSTICWEKKVVNENPWLFYDEINIDWDCSPIYDVQFNDDYDVNYDINNDSNDKCWYH